MIKVSFAYYMPARKLTGWTENFYSSKATCLLAMEKAEALRPFLMDIHGAQVRLQHIVARSVENPRLSQLKNYNVLFQPDANTQDTDYPSVSILLKLIDETGNYTTRQWIKGIWDDACKKGFYFPGTFEPKLQAFLTELQNANNGWVIRASDKANVFKDVENCSDTGQIQVTGHGYATGDRVRVGKIGGKCSLNGLWKITRIDADSFQLQQYVTPACAEPAWDGHGHVRKLAFAENGIAIKKASNEGISDRDIGRPIGSRSGRRKKKC